MDKHKAAQHLTSLIFAFMRENEYIDADVIEEIHWSGDIEHINDIAHHKISSCCAIAIQVWCSEKQNREEAYTL